MKVEIWTTTGGPMRHECKTVQVHEIGPGLTALTLGYVSGGKTTYVLAPGFKWTQMPDGEYPGRDER